MHFESSGLGNSKVGKSDSMRGSECKSSFSATRIEKKAKEGQVYQYSISILLVSNSGREPELYNPLPHPHPSRASTRTK